MRWFEELDEWRSMQELKSEDPEKTVPANPILRPAGLAKNPGPQQILSQNVTLTKLSNFRMVPTCLYSERTASYEYLCTNAVIILINYYHI